MNDNTSQKPSFCENCLINLVFHLYSMIYQELVVHCLWSSCCRIFQFSQHVLWHLNKMQWVRFLLDWILIIYLIWILIIWKWSTFYLWHWDLQSLCVWNCALYQFELETWQLPSVILVICNLSSHRLAIDFNHEEGCHYISAFSPNLDSKILFWSWYLIIGSPWYGPRFYTLECLSIYRLVTLGLLIVGIHSGRDLLLLKSDTSGNMEPRKLAMDW